MPEIKWRNPDENQYHCVSCFIVLSYSRNCFSKDFLWYKNDPEGFLVVWSTVHTDTQCCTLQWLQCLLCGVPYTQTNSVVLYNGFSVYYFGFYVKSHGVYLSLYFLVFVMWLSTLLTIHFSFLLVCALCFLYLFVFKHVYFWLPYASAAVANSVTVFARYFCGDRLPSHAIIGDPDASFHKCFKVSPVARGRTLISHPCRRQPCHHCSS